MNLFAPFNSDGYKLAHGMMYSEGTESVYSNLTPRSDRIHKKNATRYYQNKLTFIGCQGAIIETVENWDKFFKMDKAIAIAQFKFLCDNYLGKDSIPTDALAALHDIGYLPLEIKTLDEGSKVPMGVPVLTIRNTVPHAFWLVNFLETTISNLTWKPSTAATIAGEYKAMLLDFAERTGSPVEGVAFQAHDFSARGMSGPEDAARTGMGHLSSFLGSDTLGSVLYAGQYYGATGFVAASVPATEHAVATSNILRIEQELDADTYEFKTVEQMDICHVMEKNNEDARLVAEMMFLYELMLKFPTGILSYVTDSFDFWAVLTNGLPYLKDVIMRREGNGVTPGKLVIRPDSGDPETVICGYREGQFRRTKQGLAYPLEAWNGSAFIGGENVIPECEIQGALECLYNIFPGGVNEKGYNVLDEHIGLIYGDSITTQRCLAILEHMEQKGWASGNVVFGVGSFTYQCNTRDTFGFAVKATHTTVNGNDIAIFKDPKTDSKKKSAKGRLFVSKTEWNKDDGEEFTLMDNVTEQLEQSPLNALTVRFRNGEFFNLTTLDMIRSKL